MKKIFTLFTAFAITLAGITAFVPASAHAAPPCNERVFSTTRNRNSICVEYIQKMLNTLDGAGLATDHRFGSLTKTAVKARQEKFKANDAFTVVDGVVGPQTWGKLCALRANYSAVATQAGCDNPPKPAKKCKPRTFSTRTNSHDAVCVGLIKRMVNLLYIPSTLDPNTPYNAESAATVKAWQAELKKTSSNMKVDGIVGPQTWGKLCTVQSSSALLADYRKQAGC